MNRTMRIILCVILGLIAIVAIAFIPSVISTILFQFIFETGGLATLFVLVMLVPFFICIILLGLMAIVFKVAGHFFTEVKINWASSLVLSCLSVFTCFLTGLVLSKVGGLLIAKYALSPITGGLIYFGAVCFYCIAAGLAIAQVAKTKSKTWAFGVILVVFTTMTTTGMINSARKDFYDTETGAVKVHVTPSTGKIWRDKPEKLIFDPTTGEKIVSATEDQIKKAVMSSTNDSSTSVSRPSKSWQKVLTRELIGKGMELKTGEMDTPVYGVEVLKNDKVVILSDEFSHLNYGRWVNHKNRFEYICGSPENGKSVGILAPTGNKVLVEVWRQL